MEPTWPSTLITRELTADDARRIAAWHYDGRHSIYDLRADGPPLRGSDGYRAVAGADGGALVGFYCTGAEARVPGVTADDGVLDIGVGMDPAYVGRGNGKQFGTLVLSAIAEEFGTVRLRAVVQSWNRRSLALTMALGFTESGLHVCVQDGRQVEYTVVTTT